MQSYLAFIVFPHVSGDGHKDTFESTAGIRNTITTVFADLFGGYSAIEQTGGWKDSGGEVVEEASTLYYSIYSYPEVELPCDLLEVAEKAEQIELELSILAEEIKSYMVQETVLVGWDIPIGGKIKFL